MSARLMERALARLAVGAVLSPGSDGKGFAIYPNGDRRGRPIARLSMIETRMLEAEGSIHAVGDGYAITEAGRAQARRARALRDEAYAAQHRPVIDRTVIDASGTMTRTRGHDADGCLRRLAALRDASGAPWLTAAEVAVASRLRADWERGECGLVRGSDWSAPPKGGAARGPGNVLEGALAGHCDARQRVAEALEKLAPPLRRVVECVCFREEGLEALERAESWPARSGKLALKLALAQLAEGGGQLARGSRELGAGGA